MHKLKYLTISFIVVLSLLIAGPALDVSARPLAATTPPLATAAAASIIATTGVTNVGSSSTSLDVDVSPGPSCVAPVGITIGGAPHFCDPTAAGALGDAGTADTNMLGQALTSGEGPDLTGLTLVPGVYDIGAGLLSGVLTLNGPGVYIFRASSSLTTSGSIVFENGARPCDLFWHVASLATVNGSSFAGTIIAGTGVHIGANVALDGRAFAINGDVTLISDTITGPTCAAGSTGGGTGRNRVNALPQTGGGPIRNEEFPWSLVIVGSVLAIALVVGIRGYRRTHLPKQ
jgi:Ice-binding-like